MHAYGEENRGQENILALRAGLTAERAMPRQVRIEFEGAFYHVMCRGDRREAIFQDNQDRERFLATLGEAVRRTGWRVHGYVLMSNHYDFLVETPVPNLVRGMTWFQTTYAVRYNARHRASGHLLCGSIRRGAEIMMPASRFPVAFEILS